MKTAWSTVNVSQHPKYYTSDIEDEKIDIGGFFNKDNFSMTIHLLIQQQHCHISKQNKFGEVFCDYNNRLQLIPPKLIEDFLTLY